MRVGGTASVRNCTSNAQVSLLAREARGWSEAAEGTGTAAQFVFTESVAVDGAMFKLLSSRELAHIAMRYANSKGRR